MHIQIFNSFSDELIKIAKVLTHQQEEKWSCSAACLKAVLHHYDYDISEKDAIQLIGTKPNKGAETDDIVEAAKKLDFSAHQKSFTSIDEVKKILDKDIPIICDIQSFTKKGSGHYVVLEKIENGKAYIMDPNTPGNRRILPIEDFDKRWWDRRMKHPHELMKRWGIVITRRV